MFHPAQTTPQSLEELKQLCSRTPFKYGIEWFERNGFVGNGFINNADELQEFIDDVNGRWGSNRGMNLVTAKAQFELENLMQIDDNSDGPHAN